jgi:hypothetical protein
VTDSELKLQFENEQSQVLGAATTFASSKIITKTELEQKLIEIDSFYKQLENDYEKAQQRRGEIEKLVRYLKAQGSPVATYDYAAQIIDLSSANGVDYRIIVAISGIESGFCNANYKIYNCFGYLNGVQYGSYTQAFNALIPQIANQYVKVYGTNFEAMAKAYGMKNYTKHGANMRMYYNSLR